MGLLTRKSRDPIAALQGELDAKVARGARLAAKLAEAVTVQETADRVRSDLLLGEAEPPAADLDAASRRCFAAQDHRRALERASADAAADLDECRQRLAQARDGAERVAAAAALRTRADRLDGGARQLNACALAFLDAKAAFAAILAECGAGDSGTVEAITSAQPGVVGLGPALKPVLHECSRLMLPEIRPGGSLAPRTTFPHSGAAMAPADLPGLVERMFSGRLRAEADRAAAGHPPSATMIPIAAAMAPGPHDPAERRTETRRVVLVEAIRYGGHDGGELWAEVGPCDLPVRVADVAVEMKLAVSEDSWEGKRIAAEGRTVAAPRRARPEDGGKVRRTYVDAAAGVILPPVPTAKWPDADREGRRA